MSASIRLSLKAAREVLSFCEEFRHVPGNPTRAWEELKAAIAKASRASATRRTLAKPKQAKRASKKEARQEVRAAVMRRANGHCEACGSWWSNLQLDHQWGRARAESVESCRALCHQCHDEKTLSRPSAASWLENFLQFAERHGFAAEADKARKRLAFVEARGTL